MLGVLPAIALRDPGQSAAYLSSFCITSILAMGLFGAFWGEVTGRLQRLGGSTRATFLLQASSSFLSVAVGVVFLTHSATASFSLLASTANDAKAHAMSVMAATSAADKYMQAWGARAWITDPAEMPPPPTTVRDMFLVHTAMQNHPLAESAFGGLAGWKLGAVGVVPGEPALSGPLFRQFVVDAPAGVVSAAAINMHTLEAEVGFELERDLGPKADGTQYSTDEVWEAVGTIMPIIELCGRRSSAECIAAQPVLGVLADALMAGGVVMGTRHAKDTVDRAALKSYSTSLLVNGMEVAAGSTSKCPEGGPIESLTWSANHLLSRGQALKKGQVVITGATCISKEFKVGDTVTASLGALGSVAYTIAP